MKARFLKSKKLQGMAGGLLAAIVLLLVFVVLPATARENPTAAISEAGSTIGGGFGQHNTVY
jgi:hypothetical protein